MTARCDADFFETSQCRGNTNPERIQSLKDRTYPFRPITQGMKHKGETASQQATDSYRATTTKIQSIGLPIHKTSGTDPSEGDCHSRASLVKWLATDAVSLQTLLLVLSPGCHGRDAETSEHGYLLWLVLIMVVLQELVGRLHVAIAMAG